MSGFQTIAVSVPTNATANIRFHMSNIIDEIKKYMQYKYQSSSILLTKFSYDYVSPSEILESIPVPTTKSNLNQYDLPPHVLYFLLILTKSNLIRPISHENLIELGNCEKISESILTQWKESFETPYEYYGDVFDKYHLPFFNSIEFHFSKECCLLPLIPIIFHFTENCSEISQPLINMILSDDIVVSATASIIYELLCFCFRKNVAYLLN